MKTWLKPATLATSLLLSFTTLVLGFASITFSTSTKASAQNGSPQRQNSTEYFYCETVQGIPTTFYKDPQREFAFIRWDSNYFVSAGYPAKRRCGEVTARLNNYFRETPAPYITHGKMNGQPIICITDSEGGGCKGLLYTLKHYQNPEEIVEALSEKLERPTENSELREAPCRTYLNIRAAIEGRRIISRKVCS